MGGYSSLKILREKSTTMRHKRMSEMSILKELLDSLDNIKITQTQRQNSKIENFQSSITIKNRYSDNTSEKLLQSTS